MKVSAFLIYFFALFLFLSQTACVSLTGYQDGRSVGKGNLELVTSLNFAGSPEIRNDEVNFSSDILFFRFIHFEGKLRYGLTEKLDILFRQNTNFNTALGFKYQLSGDRNSEFANGMSAEIGSFGFISNAGNFQLATHHSYHPSERHTLYLSPKYIHQFKELLGNGSLSFLGANIGYMTGGKHKLVIDFGLFNVSSSTKNSVLLTTFGVGGRFSFLKN
ncbi:MAG: hypothetical protein IPM42_11530 [Saprospiraceae bacterium]|nr:hypothetical protein [Saprospiraceae bacterium]